MNLKRATLYQKSLKALSKKAPLLKTLLSFYPFPDVTASTESEDKKNDLLNTSLLTEKEISTLFIYGTALESYNDKLLEWLDEKKERHLLIFEFNIKELQLFLATELGLKLTENTKVDLFYLQAPSFWKQQKSYLKSRLGRAFEIVFMPRNKNASLNSFYSFKKRIINLSMSQNAIFLEYLYTSPNFYKNAFYNLEKLTQNRLADSLFGAFKNIPAIICGAGPSMNQTAPLLKNLLSKALVFSGGNALTVLNSFNIKPHLSLGVDPNETHLNTYSQNNFFDLPLIYRARMHYQAVDKAHGEKIYMPGAIGYPLIHWLENKLNIKSYDIDDGLNVVNFSLQIATLLGCNPIILVGCDLAYTGKEAYASTCSFDPSLPKKGTTSFSDYSINKGTYKKNALGKNVYTLWKWVEEAKWMKEFAKKHPQIHFINTNPSGLKISYFTPLPLTIVEKLFLKKEYDIEGMLYHSLLEKPPLEILQKNIQKLYLDLKKSFVKTIELLKKLKRISFSMAECILIEEDLKNEVAYKYMLEVLFDLFERVEHEKEIKIRKQKRTTFLLSMAQIYHEALNDYLFLRKIS